MVKNKQTSSGRFPHFKLFLFLALIISLGLTVLAANTKTNIQQHAASINPCTIRQSNGRYFVGGVCSGNTLYNCSGTGYAKSAQVCTNGCYINPYGQDRCNSAAIPTPTPASYTPTPRPVTPTPRPIVTCKSRGGTCYGGYSCTRMTQLGGPGQLGCSGVCCK